MWVHFCSTSVSFERVSYLLLIFQETMDQVSHKVTNGMAHSLQEKLISAVQEILCFSRSQKFSTVCTRGLPFDGILSHVSTDHSLSLGICIHIILPSVSRSVK